ncbi:peptidoglycan recognition protein 2 [Rhinolophus ferrumequinum]|uniref:Peptidoglycan recognition protein 2 n=1 Tax=Rhinolophus ferrumequinum TaxID=59479 RepID=A0A671F219_RHIFE|nr:N-acetylmuramoyl-L-alanine amidase [Rhinolophus ferrumequinum]XP_032990680.1 N-acetylmuramoyl-L-alanine amidase [Rhinolophus ferrumequinum]KAF6306875.1 peptidoglycan recognition protein 2 [Rhinolophus ferrumequinum]
MTPGSWNPTTVVQGIVWILLGLLLWPEPGTASMPLLMDSVIQALAELEQKAPVTEATHTATVWRLSAQDSGPHDPLYPFVLEGWSLKATELDPPALSPELRGLIKEVARHGVHGGQEYGVVLAPDGSTVAVEPLLAGLEAGLQGHRVINLTLDSTATPLGAGATFPDVGAVVPDIRATSPELRDTSPGVTSADVRAESPNVRATDLDVGATFPDVRAPSPDDEASSPDAKAKSPTTVDSLLGVTLARDLGLTFLQSPQTRSHPGLGAEGCWDKLSDPRNFTLLDPEASPLTTAFLNGALDGALLGDYLSRAPEPRPPLSHLLSQYYGAGVAGDPGLRSNFRRQNGAALTSAPILTQQVWGTLILLQRLEPAHPQLQGMSLEQLGEVAIRATKEFTEAFLGCPAIHPRCRWGAAPYRGSPTPLKLPLRFLYVHHTYLPAPPCTAFARCAANMRSMQRYHQDTRGWNDIGYSFVVGSDGYVYEGRGWDRVGAHTLGHNSRGFGVAFVGNYTAELPAEVALRTVRDVLPRCAVRAGFLRPDYALLGHRQLVRTACPGDALFHLLRTWPHFDANVKPRTARRASRSSKRKPAPVTLPATNLQ